MPASLIDQENGVSTRLDGLGDLREVQVHRLGVAGRQDQGRALAQLWTDRTENVGGRGALIAGRAWPGATLGPTAGNFVLLADPGFVGEPDFYALARARADCDLRQAGGERFLKATAASGFCA